jgi:hypothetical protein
MTQPLMPVRVRPPRLGVFVGCLSVWTLVQGVILGLVFRAVMDTPSNHRSGPLAVVVLIFVLAAALPVCWSVAAVRRGIELRPEGIVVRRALSGVLLPWDQIAEIAVKGGHGVRSVVVQMTNGRTHRLPAPAESLVLKDREFDAAVHAIRQWWMAATFRADNAG